MISTSPGATFESFLQGAPPGLVGALTWRLIDPTDASIEIAEGTAGISEPAAGTYLRSATAPLTADTYLAVWRNGATEVTEEVVVVAATSAPLVVPAAAIVEGWSRLDFAALGYTTDDLDRLIAQAVAYIEQVTGRIPLTGVPATLVSIALEAIQMRVEQLALQGSSEQVEGATDESGVTSFSTPGYSETRGGAKQEWRAVVLNRWQALNDLLLLLMTPEKLEEFQALLAGTMPPAFAVSEVDWMGWGWVDYWPGFGGWE